jgi:hypothetical protein
LSIIDEQRTIAQMLNVDSNGYRLKKFYLNLGVTTKWQNGHEIEWETGIAKSSEIVNKKTYCTRFVAATCKKAGVYTLHPEYPTDKFGANTLYDWLDSRKARKSGWKLVEGSDLLEIYCHAQQYANNGRLVIAIYKDPSRRPGHSALIMPAIVGCEEIRAIGPVLIQAGGRNSDSLRLSTGFRKRIHSWPEEKILLYYNEVIPFDK